MTHDLKCIAILHGAGYAGGELAALLLRHPHVEIAAVTSRSHAGEPLAKAHARLRGTTDLTFTAPEALDPSGVDAVVVCAEHGKGAAAVHALREAGFEGLIVDLSADHRLAQEAYDATYPAPHPHPEQIADAVYGLAEVNRDAIPGATLVANPGCFATAMALALWPLAGRAGTAHITAFTGASGSGARPSPTTHFPTRDGNARAYRPFAHRHQPEVEQVVGDAMQIQFVPVSAPWTRGIWGTAHVALDAPLAPDAVATLYQEAYSGARFVRLSPEGLPELLPVVGTPFCDIGWVSDGDALVVGFALDNLLKGAASQAVQNLNLALGLPETAGLLP
ncbi:N-acetyl-gamma-glutamyl-phosphate reductase [Rubricoccus marinus]|uniref:N-acetyl-gamma-glutamyl-phosphate reductase n=1 Tax=Rubricoccus marinus TaxID=716817 RepID=A0A259U1R0_9BACT|nr:N-acetyl-gamma-glutamyl-phosphate reductase [Rubricoccus marinus]OZC03983.1 N-acetyl-gamma-glutamyl-phosphate reductase [Rubricoccus marinus]